MFVCFPNENPDAWKPLAYIANSKPSAIFKTSGPQCSAIIGISIELEQQVLATVAASATSSSYGAAAAGGSAATSTALASCGTAVGFPFSAENKAHQSVLDKSVIETGNGQLVQRIACNVVRNLFNFAASFVTSGSVPLDVLQEWIKTLERKASLQPEIFLRDPNETS